MDDGLVTKFLSLPGPENSTRRFRLFVGECNDGSPWIDVEVHRFIVGEWRAYDLHRLTEDVAEYLTIAKEEMRDLTEDQLFQIAIDWIEERVGTKKLN